ncbi:MAG: hypothetical protein WEB60_09815 [Terrimicrobiaceae bacterium]
MAFLLLALLAGGCAGPKSPEGPPTARPVKGFVASSDLFWLSEMLSQRLTISQSIAWSRFSVGQDWPDPEMAAGDLAVLVEQCRRLGLPPAEAKTFFAIQQQAAAEQEIRLHRQWNKKAGLPGTAPLSIDGTLGPQLETVDLQMIATLVRLQGFPQGKEVKSFFHKQLEKRDFKPSVIRTAVSAFAPQ